MINVVFVLTKKMLATSISWPIDMLTAANQIAKVLCPEKPSFKLLSTTIGDLDTDGTAPCSMLINYLPEQITQADLIYLPALWRNPRPVLKTTHHVLNRWLRHHYEKGATISGAGTGCYFMAEAGLLDHKPATTHWHYFDQFQRRYPSAQLKREHFITNADNLYCAASISALADLTIHFIQQYFNTSVAQHVARHFSPETRRTYDTVSYSAGSNLNHSDEDILQIQLWIKHHLGKHLVISDIARKFGMSTRNFSRRFNNATGKTPLHYIQDARINMAKDLLQSSNLSIGSIVEKTGYNDASHFSRLFHQNVGITPRKYRITVRAKLFHEE